VTTGSSRKRNADARNSEDHLAHIEAIKVKLENGRTETFRIVDEVHVPEDMTQLVDALRRSPARVAFWAAQVERAFDELRKQEARQSEKEGKAFLNYKHAYETQQGPTTDRLVHESVQSDPDVVKVRLMTASLRKQVGLLRAVHKAVEHRGFVLDRLVAREVK